MQETFFTTSVIMGFFNLMKELGFLGFIAGGLAVFAFGYGYHQMHPDATVPKHRNWSAIRIISSRVLLGSILFVVGGLNGFFHFVPVQMVQDCVKCSEYINGLIASGFLFETVKIIEIFTGALFLMGLWIPLALILYVPIVLNIGDEEDFKGIVDLVKNVAIVWHEENYGSTFDVIDIPEDLKAEAEKLRGELIEAVAEYDEKLLEKYFDDPDSITEDEIHAALRAATQDISIIPMVCGSAF